MVVLFYKPPCGKWYVHSHKMYPTKEAARVSAAKFLSPGTTIATIHISDNVLDDIAIEVK